MTMTKNALRAKCLARDVQQNAVNRRWKRKIKGRETFIPYDPSADQRDVVFDPQTGKIEIVKPEKFH
jgi:hypothetical protein